MGVAQLTPLYVAVDYGSKAMFAYLLENGANPDISNAETGMTPLVRAIAHERESMVDALLGARATAKQSEAHRGGGRTGDLFEGNTALLYALMDDNPDLSLIERLFKAGASADEIYFLGRPPLMAAASAPPAYLLQRGADPNAVDQSGRSVMMHLLEKEPLKIANLRTLLGAGASVEWAGNEPSPLLGMVWRGNAQAVAILLEAGAQVDIPLWLSDERMPMIWGDQERLIARNGGTLLMMAVALGHAAVARELVKAGADPKLSIKVGDKVISAESLAADAGSPLLIKALLAP